jgi:hypothetical protein
MIPVSPAFLVAVRQSHRRELRVTALPSGTVLPVDEGTVKFGLGKGGAAAVNTRSGDIVVPGYAWVPTAVDSPLAPFGQRVKIEIGVVAAGGVEWADLGEMLVLTTDVVRPGGAIKVSLIDDSYVPAQDELDTDVTLSSTAPAMAQILDMLRPVLPGITAGADASSGADPNDIDYLVKAGASRWEACKRLAWGVRCSVGFNRLGQVELTTASPKVVPVTVLDRFTNLQSAVTREGLYNRVVVLQVDQANPPNTGRGEAAIVDGPLTYGGPMGKLTKVITQGGLLAASDASAKAAADRALMEYQNRVREVKVAMPPMPHLESGDVVELIFPNGAAEVAQVQEITHGLGADKPTTMTARWLNNTGPIPMSARHLQPGHTTDFLAGEVPAGQP